MHLPMPSPPALQSSMLYSRVGSASAMGRWWELRLAFFTNACNSDDCFLNQLCHVNPGNWGTWRLIVIDHFFESIQHARFVQNRVSDKSFSERSGSCDASRIVLKAFLVLLVRNVLLLTNDPVRATKLPLSGSMRASCNLAASLCTLQARCSAKSFMVPIPLAKKAKSTWHFPQCFLNIDIDQVQKTPKNQPIYCKYRDINSNILKVLIYIPVFFLPAQWHGTADLWPAMHAIVKWTQKPILNSWSQHSFGVYMVTCCNFWP